MNRRVFGAAILGLALVAPVCPAAADEIAADVQQAWDAARTPSSPGWEPAVPAASEAPAVAEATALEQSFDLAAARTAFGDVCEGLPTDWTAWTVACEGAARTAYGLGDDDALDRALESLLARRPDHELAVGRFPPDVRERADALRATLPNASLEVADSLAEVTLDGVPLGVAPLRLPRLPAGEHRISCNGWSHTFQVGPGGAVALACPAPADLDDPLPYLLATSRGEPTLAEVAEGTHGMDPGTWVFYGAEEGSAVLVHAPATGPGPWLQAVRRVRTPAD